MGHRTGGLDGGMKGKDRFWVLNKCSARARPGPNCGNSFSRKLGMRRGTEKDVGCEVGVGVGDVPKPNLVVTLTLGGFQSFDWLLY